MLVKIPPSEGYPDGLTFRLLQPAQLKLITKIRIQQETGYGPVKMAAGLAGLGAIQQILAEVPAGEMPSADVLEKLAAEGDIDLLALGCLFWGSRLEQGEPTITLAEACDFMDLGVTYELEPEEKRAAEEAAKQARPTQAALAPSPARERNGTRSPTPTKSTSKFT